MRSDLNEIELGSKNNGKGSILNRTFVDDVDRERQITELYLLGFAAEGDV